MAAGQNRPLLRQLDGLFRLGITGELTDGQLLERFATLTGEGAEEAFSVLVERHGPMVLRICAGVLPNPHDREDAFQATFLVLVRKARGLWVHDTLGPWLHQVALRTAWSARTRAARRSLHEQAAAAELRSRGQTPEPLDEAPTLLHEEINRLPDRFRLPLVLCDLEGQTHEQAARALGWPIGTVKSRQARARERLRDRLTRRGLAPTASILAGAPRPAGLSLLPESLVSDTTVAAIRFAASGTRVGGSAALLAHGVLNAMFITRWLKTAAVVLVAGATISGAGVLAGKRSSRTQDQATSATPVVEVSAGTFTITASGRGVVKAQQTNHVRSAVNMVIGVASILPDGTRVKKGDLVAELRVDPLHVMLENQRTNLSRRAEEAYQDAVRKREDAESALKQYEQGTYALERAAIQSEIHQTEIAGQRATARLEQTRKAQERLAHRLKQRGEDTAEILAGLELTDRVDTASREMEQAALSREMAQHRLKILDDFTKPVKLRALNAELAKARAAETLPRQALEEEQRKEAKIQEEIRNCKLYAPTDGIMYRDERIAVDTMVSVGSTIFWVFDHSAPLAVNASVGESMIDRVSEKQKVRVKVDAFPGRVLTGTVYKIKRGPDPAYTGPPGSAPRLSSTLVKLDPDAADLRPGMTASVEIVLSERDHVITVPRESIVRHEGRDRVAVRQADGGTDWRGVQLGEASATRIEVKEGLKPGEKVVLHPSLPTRPEEPRRRP